MQYITAVALAERPGARELAQVATAEHLRMVPFELMEATLRGGDRSTWTADQVAAADDALQRIEEAVGQAESMVDGFLARRGYPLPLSPVPELVTGWVRDIARYLLHKDRGGQAADDPIVRAYRDALKFLEMIAAGKFSLGANDPIQTDPNLVDVRFDSSPSVFNRDQLRAFR
ncbi:gp436 family protein [Pseudomonas sp.]|uniref:gp436 family protein n=1 Tax=Pseudomonas sp. TaxID=306 RepID=UPI003D10327F